MKCPWCGREMRRGRLGEEASFWRPETGRQDDCVPLSWERQGRAGSVGWYCPFCLRVVAEAAKPTLITAFGDSNTRYWLSATQEPGPPEQAWPALVEKALRAEGRRVRVVNEGWPGGETSFAKAQFERRTLGAGGVILAFGTNDIKRPEATAEAYRADLEGILKRNGHRPMLVLSILWFDRGYGFLGSQDRLAVWNGIAKELCEAYGAPFWDTTPWFERQLQYYGDCPAHHLNAAGQERMAQAVLEGLRAHHFV